MKWGFLIGFLSLIAPCKALADDMSCPENDPIQAPVKLAQLPPDYYPIVYSYPAAPYEARRFTYYVKRGSEFKVLVDAAIPNLGENPVLKRAWRCEFHQTTYYDFYTVDLGFSDEARGGYAVHVIYTPCDVDYNVPVEIGDNCRTSHGEVTDKMLFLFQTEVAGNPGPSTCLGGATQEIPIPSDVAVVGDFTEFHGYSFNAYGKGSKAPRPYTIANTAWAAKLFLLAQWAIKKTPLNVNFDSHGNLNLWFFNPLNWIEGNDILVQFLNDNLKGTIQTLTFLSCCTAKVNAVDVNLLQTLANGLSTASVRTSVCAWEDIMYFSVDGKRYKSQGDFKTCAIGKGPLQANNPVPINVPAKFDDTAPEN